MHNLVQVQACSPALAEACNHSPLPQSMQAGSWLNTLLSTACRAKKLLSSSRHLNRVADPER